MYCLLDVNQDGSLQPQAFEALVRRLDKDVRGFCDRIADCPEPVIERIMMNLPARIVHNVPPLRSAALRSLLPLLDAIVTSRDTPDQMKGPAFQEAEELLGVTVTACGSEEILVARAREEAERRA
jgi:hypothetical protein